MGVDTRITWPQVGLLPAIAAEVFGLATLGRASRGIERILVLGAVILGGLVLVGFLVVALSSGTTFGNGHAGPL
jgi:hypothetical protein